MAGLGIEVTVFRRVMKMKVKVQINNVIINPAATISLPYSVPGGS